MAKEETKDAKVDPVIEDEKAKLQAQIDELKAVLEAEKEDKAKIKATIMGGRYNPNLILAEKCREPKKVKVLQGKKTAFTLHTH